MGARELGFVEQGSDQDHWTATRLGRIAATASPAEKVVLLRFQLEEYGPYILFRNRLLAGEPASEAARQTCVTYELSVEPFTAQTLLTGFGTYSGGLIYGEAQRLQVIVDPELLAEAVAAYDNAMISGDTLLAFIIRQLGPIAAAFVTGEILDRLVDSYMVILRDGPLDESMFHLGRAVEGFIKRLPELDPPLVVPIEVKTMGQVARFLKDEGRIKTNQHALIGALTTLRNAADHPMDPEIGTSWGFSRGTALAGNHLAWAIMRSFFITREGDFVL